MGVNFSLDALKIAAEPMIFFADPASTAALAAHMDAAVTSRLSFYAYRQPGDSMISFGGSERVVEGIGAPGFVIGRFDTALPYLTIPWSNAQGKQPETGATYSFPKNSTTADVHRMAVNNIVKQLSPGEKAVLTTVNIEEKTIETAQFFMKLCVAYPQAFVYCFSTPMTGFWIGATPETLLKGHSSRLTTMSLAGTRPKDTNADWDNKNIEEQEIVTHEIASQLQLISDRVDVGDTFTRPAGNVEHLCTPIEAVMPSGFDSLGLEHLLRNLAPSPAVCGHPRQKALQLIHDNEHFERVCYGGFCGPYRSAQDFDLYVTLRCALIEQNRYALFAGGGITHLSKPEDEWKETRLKLQTLAPFME